MNILALIFVLLVSLSLVGGGILGIYLNKNKKINIELIINYLFGSMVTLIAVKLIPNIIIISEEFLGRWKGLAICSVLAFLGFVIIKQIDLFIPHHEEYDKKHEHSCYHYHLKHVAYILITSIVIYNVIQGIDLFNNINEDFERGLLVCLSYIIWNIPIGIIIIYKLINLLKQKNTIIISCILSFLILLGGLMALLFNFNNQIILTLLLSVTLGMMIFLVFCELLDQIIKIEDKKNIIIGLVSGILLSLISIILG